MSERTDGGISVCGSYEELLPKEFISGFTLTGAYITTFSLETEMLAELLYSVGAFVPRPKELHIYYNKFSRSAITGAQPVPERCFHEVTPNNGRAFHPKVILLKYGKGGETRFVFMVLSRNVFDSYLLDAYAVTYGICGDNEGNGKDVEAFFNGFDSGTMPAGTKEQLRRTSFVIGDEKREVRFLDGSGVMQAITGRRDLIVVSPFLSDGFFGKSGAAFRKIVSTDEGFGRLNGKTLSAVGSVCAGMREHILHAKIYCWRENERTYRIIGSSNATNNGCGAGNTEFNVLFEGGADEYDDFLRLLNDNTVPLNTERLEKKENNGFDASGIFRDFCESTDIKCGQDDGEYVCTLSPKRAFSPENCSVSVSGPDGDKAYAEGSITFSGSEPFLSLSVTVSDTGGSFRSFCLSLYGYWDSAARKALDERCEAEYLACLHRIKDRIFSGRPVRAAQFADAEGAKSSAAPRRYAKKDMDFENLLRLRGRCGSAEEFDAGLERLRGVVLTINEITGGQQEQLLELIESFKGENV